MEKSRNSEAIPTEINSVPEPYFLKKPIPIQVQYRGENDYFAKETVIGLLDGFGGTTPEEAAELLRDAILDQYDLFQEERENLADYAEFVSKRLEGFVGKN